MQTEELRINEPLPEEARLAKDIVECILKAKKLLRMYPANNPIYINASKEIYDRLKRFFERNNNFALRISMNAIKYRDDQIYHNPGKDNNLALFFFKDGLREITFLNGISQTELEKFISILNIDFEKDAPDDDIVTLLWEGDFKHITYYVDEDFLGDWEIPCDYEMSEQTLAQAYQDALIKETEQSAIQVDINDVDYQYLASEVKKQGQPKLKKIMTILFELLYQTENSDDIREIIRSIKDSLEYCIIRGDFNSASHVLDMVKAADARFSKNFLKTIYVVINGKAFIEKIGKVLESPTEINREYFASFIKHLDERSVRCFIDLLGQLQSIEGRNLTIDALTFLGQHYFKALAKGLNDSRWDVVRNTALVLGKIASPDSIKYLDKTLAYPDHRVRKEAVSAISNIKSPETVQSLKKALNDTDKSIRITALRGLGNIKTGNVKKLLLAELSGKKFNEKDFNEKKEFYRVIAYWHDQEVKDFLIKTLKRKKFWARTKNTENRACAAHALGIINAKDSIEILEKASRSKNKLLRDMSISALKGLANI